MRHRLLSGLLLILVATAAAPAQGPRRRKPPTEVHVDPRRGSDRNPGTSGRPVRSLSAALALLPDPVERDVSIHLEPGRYADTGGIGMPAGRLDLQRRMRPGVEVRLVGRTDEKEQPVLAWEGESCLVWARAGTWRLENVQVGSFTKRQRCGCRAEGDVRLRLKDVRFRLRSHSGAAIHARRGGWIGLRGRIAINEHLHEQAEEETFAGILAEDFGIVRFDETRGSDLDMGNGSLSARYYGIIRLGCPQARITSWGRQSNNLAVNNSGRVDLHDSAIVLRAHQPENTPIGLEHDGHILAEGARIRILGKNNCAIALQKASTFTGNHIALEGEFRKSLWGLSGSMFVGRFVGDVGLIEAHTGATLHVEKIDGKLRAEPLVRSGATVSLPGGRVVR